MSGVAGDGSGKRAGAEPLIVFPDGVTPAQARRLADIADAIPEAEALVDARLYAITEAERAEVGLGLCEGCGCRMEYGHCYCCLPVDGYGERFFEQRHPDGISHAGGKLRQSGGGLRGETDR